MTTALKPIPGVTPAANTATLLYTAPANNTAVILLVVLNNNPATAATYSIHHVPSAGSPATLNKIVLDQPLSPKERHGWEEKHFMNAGDTLYVIADVTGIYFRGTVAEVA